MKKTRLASHYSQREVKTVAFEITQEEMDVYNDLTIYSAEPDPYARRFDERRARAFGFMVALYQRRFASSPHALKRSLEASEASNGHHGRKEFHEIIAD